MRRLLLLLACLVGLPHLAEAVSIPHAFVTQTTEQSTTSSTYGDMTGVSIASGNFTAGKKYLVCANASVAEDSSTRVGIRVVHGSTAFAESENLTTRSSTVKEYYAYQWCTVWTAVSSEGVKVQLNSSDGVSNAYAHFLTLFTLQLDDYLIENTDWCFNERSTDDALTNSGTNGAACTVTPATGGHDWLVMSWSQIDATSGTVDQQSRLVRSGEASSSNPQVSFQPLSTSAQYVLPLARVFTLGAAANTFTEQSQAGAATTHTRLHSSIFVLNLNKFLAHANTYTDGAVTLGTTDYNTQVETVSINPAGTYDVWVGGFFVGDKQATSGDVEMRIQVDNADILSGMTTASINYDNADVTVLTNDYPEALQTVASMTTGTNTIDFDASSDISSGLDAKHRSLWAVTLELANPGSTVGPLRRRHP